ncbi:MAG: hypothetical protein ACLPJH_20825 [Myxococcaceae bacterium]
MVRPAAEGFRVVWDAGSLDAGWVLLPGLAALAMAVLLLLLARRLPARRRRRALSGAGAVALWLLAVWWTLGGLGAWRAGVGRLHNATANLVEGTLFVQPSLEALQVADVSVARAQDGLLAPLHACRWPALQPFSGQTVRLFFFGQDVLRLEVEAKPAAPGQGGPEGPTARPL